MHQILCGGLQTIQTYVEELCASFGVQQRAGAELLQIGLDLRCIPGTALFWPCSLFERPTAASGLWWVKKGCRPRVTQLQRALRAG